MDERTKEKLADAVKKFLHDLIRIADEGYYDRDSFVRASADMLAMMAEVSIFQNFEEGGRPQ